MPDAAVRVGGRYRLGRKLAAGGMGAVWEGWDERLHRPIAVKRLQLEPWHSEEERNLGVQRAMREARLTARLHHPNVVQVFDIVDDGESPCLIMEYVPSRSLHQLVHERGALPYAEVAGIGAQVAAGLAAAHAAGVVHRDVKPGNVLITDEGVAKVSDFGISHAFDDVTVTSTGILVGTPAYLAPEVVRGAAPGFAADVYSLGATLYLAVEGEAPFGTDGNAMAVLDRVATGQWPQPVRAGALAPLLNRMMALEPDQRPTMAEVAAGLRELQRHPASVQPTEVLTLGRSGTRPAPFPVRPQMYPPGTPADQTRTARRRIPLLPLLAAVLVVVLGGVIGWALLSGNGGGGAPSGRSAVNPPASAGATSHSSAAGSGTSRPRPVTHGPPTAQQLAAAITTYFRTVPGDLRTGWSLLTPSFQKGKAKNWGVYQAFWHTVDHVDVTWVKGRPPHTATAHLVYYYKNGQVVAQTTTFTLRRQDGVVKIAAET